MLKPATMEKVLGFLVTGGGAIIGELFKDKLLDMKIEQKVVELISKSNS